MDAAHDRLPHYGGDEATFIAASRDGEAEIRITFDHLYAAYVDRIHAYLKALTTMPSYRALPEGIGSWIFRIARNVLVDSTRRGRPSISLDLESVDSSDLHIHHMRDIEDARRTVFS